jgi:enoyl-CoA hydratase/carnithine racemase
LAEVGAALVGQVRVVVLRAEGQTFSAGLDLRMITAEGIPGEMTFHDMAGLAPAALMAIIEHYQRAFSWLREPSFVSIAAVQGHAVGAGFQLALACDLRVVADDALFAMREPSLGLVPDLTGTHPLVAAVGYSRALEICATGRWVGSDEAARIGLANLAVPREELDDAVNDLARALLSAPAGAVAETKALLQRATVNDYPTQLAAERTAQGRRLRALLGGGALG